MPSAGQLGCAPPLLLIHFSGVEQGAARYPSADDQGNTQKKNVHDRRTLEGIVDIDWCSNRNPSDGHRCIEQYRPVTKPENPTDCTVASRLRSMRIHMSTRFPSGRMHPCWTRGRMRPAAPSERSISSPPAWVGVESEVCHGCRAGAIGRARRDVFDVP